MSRRCALRSSRPSPRLTAYDNAELDSEELARAGFDPELLLTWLYVNRDGKISRDEFVESLLELYSGDSASSMWNQKELRRRVQLYSADSASSMWNQKELRRLHELLSGGSVWGSRTVLRAINAPRFELISLVAVLVTALCYAVGTLPELGNESRFWLNNVEADFFTVVFLVEYVLRWWSRSFSLKYLLKPTNLIDLLSIAPTFLSVRRPGGGRGCGRRRGRASRGYHQPIDARSERLVVAAEAARLISEGLRESAAPLAELHSRERAAHDGRSDGG